LNGVAAANRACLPDFAPAELSPFFVVTSYKDLTPTEPPSFSPISKLVSTRGGLLINLGSKSFEYRPSVWSTVEPRTLDSQKSA
jgi:hypothetical protein